MTDADDDLAQTSVEGPETIEDFRATATAFSQLAGVLGGFSMTILVLVLSLLEENKTARDWTVGLLLLAATAYIYASGILANSMNVRIFAKRKGDPGKTFSIQRHEFDYGIAIFHVGNMVLPIALVITVYQASLWVGLISSVAIVLLAARVVAINLFGLERILAARAVAIDLLRTRHIPHQPKGDHIHRDINGDSKSENANPTKSNRE